MEEGPAIQALLPSSLGPLEAHQSPDAIVASEYIAVAQCWQSGGPAIRLAGGIEALVGVVDGGHGRDPFGTALFQLEVHHLGRDSLGLVERFVLPLFGGQSALQRMLGGQVARRGRFVGSNEIQGDAESSSAPDGRRWTWRAVRIR